MNRKIKIVIVLLIIGAVMYFGHQHLKEEGPEEVEEVQQKESQREIAIEKMAEKYNALVDWNRNICYTIQLQDLLVNSNKPVLFTGTVDDIFEKNNQYYIRFITGGIWSWEFSETKVYFVLKCDTNKVLEIMKEIDKKSEDDLSPPPICLWEFGEYIVVAKIENVTKPIFQINATRPTLQISGYEIESEEVELEYEPSDTFVATGTCIDFVYIGEETN